MQERQIMFAERVKGLRPAPWDLIPDLGLYMDQVITYVERQCSVLYRNGERVLTPSMVNNYVKIGLVGRPVDKKYGREQLAQLLMICVLKQATSAEGMKELLRLPEGGMQVLYEDFCCRQQAAIEELTASLPLPSAIYCAVRSAAYVFLCNDILGKKPKSDEKEDAGATQVNTGTRERNRGKRTDVHR